MKNKRIVKVNRRPRDLIKGFSLLRCEYCNSLLVTSGMLKAGMVKCPECNWSWSIDRLGLKLVGERYYWK